MFSIKREKSIEENLIYMMDQNVKELLNINSFLSDLDNEELKKELIKKKKIYMFNIYITLLGIFEAKIKDENLDEINKQNLMKINKQINRKLLKEMGISYLALMTDDRNNIVTDYKKIMLQDTNDLQEAYTSSYNLGFSSAKYVDYKKMILNYNKLNDRFMNQEEKLNQNNILKKIKEKTIFSHND